MKIIAGNLRIVEQWRFQKRYYDNTRAVKTINTSSSVIHRHLTREFEMWFIQALRILFHENVPEEVLEMSCSWFLDFLRRLSGFKSYLPPQGFGLDGQNPRRHIRIPRVQGIEFRCVEKKSRFRRKRFAKDCRIFAGGK